MIFQGKHSLRSWLGNIKKAPPKIVWFFKHHTYCMVTRWDAMFYLWQINNFEIFNQIFPCISLHLLLFLFLSHSLPQEWITQRRAENKLISFWISKARQWIWEFRSWVTSNLPGLQNPKRLRIEEEGKWAQGLWDGRAKRMHASLLRWCPQEGPFRKGMAARCD